MDKILAEGRALVDKAREDHNTLYDNKKQAISAIKLSMLIEPILEDPITAEEPIVDEVIEQEIADGHALIKEQLAKDLTGLGYDSLMGFFAANQEYCDKATEEEAKELDVLWK